MLTSRHAVHETRHSDQCKVHQALKIRALSCPITCAELRVIAVRLVVVDANCVSAGAS